MTDHEWLHPKCSNSAQEPETDLS